MSRIPAEARIQIVRTVKRSGTGFQPVSELKRNKYEDRQDACPTIIVPPAEVRAQFRRVKSFANFSVEQRGWTLDVLNLVRRICDRCSERQFAHSKGQSRLTSAATREFTNEDVYAHARELEQLHPDNRHIRDKIRQQLQILRDAKLLIHVGSGVWRLP